MKWLHKRKIKTPNSKAKVVTTAKDLISEFKKSSDFVHYVNQKELFLYYIYYFKSLIEVEVLHRDILPYLPSEMSSLDELKDMLPFANVIHTSDLKLINEKILSGHIFIQLSENDDNGLLIHAALVKERQIAPPEVEFSVIGPKEAFVESIDTNINLIRKRIPCVELQIMKLSVGKITKNKVAVIHLSGIANEENVNTVVQRIENITIDQIIDSSFINQLICDNHNSLFPQLLDTERPDRVAAVLAEGKVVILVDGSPHALIGPTTLVEFFSAFEDYFLNSHIASIFRLIRVFAVMFSILITPIYVGALTHHFELIPTAVLATLITSRAQVPLPPILEALFLELTIELLREAGARLPTKVGQTIGIVGGIVIGTASVEAGLTSSVLLIIVALAALASFTTPVYQMGNTIRLIRFPFLILAHVWGLVGIVLCFCYLLVHLIRLTSLGRPFLEPVFPLRIADFKDTLIRLPMAWQAKRPIELMVKNKTRFPEKQAKKYKDIDE